MLNIHHDESRPSRVTVAFEDGAFMLSRDVTFEDLAERLDRLSERHYGKPIAIEVKFAAASKEHRRRLISEFGRGIGAATSRDARSNLDNFRASHQAPTSTPIGLVNARGQ